MTRRTKTIALTLTERCNLNCVYCYEHDKDYTVMSLDTAKNAIEKHFVDSDAYDEIEINFHGGEPFLEFDRLKEISEWVWQQQWPKPYHMFATTNGTVITTAIKDWLIKHRSQFIVGLSLDGTKAMHDINRSSSYSYIDRDFFLRNWPYQGVKMTISPFTVSALAEGVKELHSFGFIVNANPALGVDWNQSSLLNAYASQLRILADFYLDHPNITPCSLFNMNLTMVSNAVTNLSPKWCGTGKHMVAISPENTEYPCHAFMPSVNFGNITDRNAWDLLKKSDFQDIRCKDCILKHQCATCYGMNLFERGSIEKRDENYCKLNKIRAIANSYLYGHMIMSPDKYPHLDKNNIPNIALGVLKIQRAFGEEEVPAF